jgi:hypothetical protein
MSVNTTSGEVSPGVHVTLGDYIYVDTQYGRFLRKVNWVGEHFIEWSFGYCPVKSVSLNPNKVSKVKFIILNQ